MASYKQRKEDFVSNLTGGSVSEISFVTAVAPVSLAFILWCHVSSQMLIR